MGKYAIDVNTEPTRTQQSAADECDINKIVERAKRGAELPVSGRQPFYGDFTELPTDLRDCMNSVIKANDAFMSLDAQIRRRFDNDAAKLMEFLNDPANREEAISLGIVAAPPKPPVVEPDPALETLKSIDKSLKSKKSKDSDD